MNFGGTHPPAMGFRNRSETGGSASAAARRTGIARRGDSTRRRTLISIDAAGRHGAANERLSTAV